MLSPGGMIDKGWVSTYGAGQPARRFRKPPSLGDADCASAHEAAATMSPTPAMFNALNSGITFKLTVDTGSTPPGRGFQAIVIRSDLVNSGQVKGYEDLKGLRLAIPGRGISNEITLDKALRLGGLTQDDVTLETLGYADMQA